jgi:hypothetical protein
LFAPVGTSPALDDSVALLLEKHEILQRIPPVGAGHLVWALWLKDFTIMELL